MAWTVASAFTQFERLIEPTDAQIKSIQPKVNVTHNYLAKAFTAATNMPLRTTKLMGSAAQGTLIRPVDDVDLLAVFNDPQGIWSSTYRNNSQAFIHRVKGAFGNSRVETIGVRGQAVRLFYKTGAHVDIAPVFGWKAGGYILPSGDGAWLRTDPDAQQTWLAGRDQTLSNNLLPLIRLLKRWNSVHGKQLKSYHLSVMAATIFISMNNDRADALMTFFKHAPNYLDVEDPAGYSGKLSSYLTYKARNDIVARLQNA